MSYPQQLTILVLTGLGTLAWKIALAVAKEKKEQQSGVNQKRSSHHLNGINTGAWPTPNSSKSREAGKFLVFLFLTLSLASLGNVQANFHPDKSAGCPPLLVNFTSLASANSTYFWDFGNGNTSTHSNPSATFLASGSYRVKLVVTNGTQIDSMIKNIRVFQLPVVNFTVSKTSACLTDTLHFQNNISLGDGPITNYAWGFGNGLASSDSSAYYRYNQPGVYNITLVVRDSNGCAANKTIAGYVKVFPSPVAAFTATPQNSCSASQMVSFTNQSTGNGISYFWNLGDSATSTAAAPTHTYQQEQRTVQLTVTDSIGCHSETSKIVSATYIIANFKASKTRACTDEKLIFTNLSNFAGTSWIWNFGDGTTSTANSPAKKYTTAGHYTVSFIINDGACGDSITKVSYITIINGLPVTTATFSADTTITCGGPILVHFTNNTPGGVSYLWNFGNGDTSITQNPSMLFTGGGDYNISLTIIDSNGCSITGSVVNFIQTVKPVAKFSSDTIICAGGAIQFTNHSSNASSFLWNFGDGDTSSIGNPTHHYLHRGNYTVTLTAFNHAGCDTTVIKRNYIHVDSVYVNFRVNSNFSPCPPFVCVMQNLSARNVIKYVWDFGDGYTDTAANPIHIYFYPGVYSVSLTGYTRQGCFDSVRYNNLIVVQGPTGSFNISPKTGCSPVGVVFSATVSSNTLNSWCDFGDGTVLADSLNFTHAYATPKVYHPQFILTDHVGCTVSYPLDSITIYSSPGKLNNIDTSICAGNAFTVSLGSNSNRYQWVPARFLNCDTCSIITINPTDSITYQVTATNEFGCQSSSSVKVNVEALPVLNDSVVVSLCKNDTCHLFAGNAARVTWSPAQYLSDAGCAHPVCTPLVSTIYTVHAYSSLGCTAATKITVNVTDKLDISLPDSAVVCSGGSIQLNPKLNICGSAGNQYSWSPSAYLDNSNSATPTATLNDKAINFQLIVSNGHCVADTATITVYTDIPQMQVSPAVTTTPYSEVLLSATSTEVLTYKWSAQNALTCDACANTFINPTSSQMAYVEGKNQLGCVVNDSIPIVVKEADAPTVFIPNAFTPNGDGNNDVFEIYGNLQNLEFLEIQIFNRWGEMVFESNNHHFKWDGTYKGVIQNPGVFTYQLQLAFNDGKTEQLKKGSVTLLR